jgi:hypothetical protein
VQEILKQKLSKSTVNEMKKKMTKMKWSNVLWALLFQELMIVMGATDFLKLIVAGWEQTIDGATGADRVGGTVVSGG